MENVWKYKNYPYFCTRVEEITQPPRRVPGYKNE